MTLPTLNEQPSPLKGMDINNFTAHLGGREETQLNPLIATRVIFPVDLGFQNCVFIFIHSKSGAQQK